MTYEELLDKYRSKEVFIHGRAVIQIVEMKTYVESEILKTDFIYHTERNRRGVITIEHKGIAAENIEISG